MGPFQRGFFCEDESLSYPYRSSTVTPGMLICENMFLPILVFILVEWWRLRSQESNVKTTKICGRNVHPLLGAAGASFRTYILGYLCAAMIDTFIKLSVGRLRPHFIDVCKPDWSQIQCTTSDGRPNYVDPIPCTCEDNFRMMNSRMSFPSGHAASSMFAMVYLIIYLQVRLRTPYKALRVIPQLVFLTLGLYSGLSRIHDYKHHWSDVLAGFMEGFIEAVLWTNFVANLALPNKRLLTISQDHEKEKVADTEEHFMENV